MKFTIWLYAQIQFNKYSSKTKMIMSEKGLWEALSMTFISKFKVLWHIIISTRILIKM